MSAAARRWVIADIATELGVARSTIEGYRSRRQMPAATGVVGRTPYWTDRAIQPWLEQQRRNRKHIGRG